MTTNVDIVNRSLQLIGTRTTIAAMNEQSNEAVQANLVYTAVQNWCLVQANWNFARTTAILSEVKHVTAPVGTWTTSSPVPPWLYEYTLPTNFLRALYLTNTASITGNTYWLGEPQRFVTALDTIATIDTKVLLTNVATPAILIYTKVIDDPTLWPAFFERFVVAMLAWTLAPTLTEDKELVKYLDTIMTRFLATAVDINRAEGLDYKDTTPIWIQASGIEYPAKRLNVGMPTKDRNNDYNNY